MAENIVLSVQLNGADAALAQLTQLDSVVTRLKANRNVKISVNARSLATAATNAQTLNTNLSQVTQNAKAMGNTGAQGVQKTGAAIQKASRNAESFNTGMGNVVLTMAKFRLASAAINLVATGFKEAFAEMKRVDSEMVTIRKVTGFTADEMERLSQNAYSLEFFICHIFNYIAIKGELKRKRQYKIENNELVELKGVDVVEIDELIEELKNTNEEWIIVGEAVYKYEEKIKKNTT